MRKTLIFPVLLGIMTSAMARSYSESDCQIRGQWPQIVDSELILKGEDVKVVDGQARSVMKALIESGVHKELRRANIEAAYADLLVCVEDLPGENSYHCTVHSDGEVYEASVALAEVFGVFHETYMIEAQYPGKVAEFIVSKIDCREDFERHSARCTFSF